MKLKMLAAMAISSLLAVSAAAYADDTSTSGMDSSAQSTPDMSGQPNTGATPPATTSPDSSSTSTSSDDMGSSDTSSPSGGDQDQATGDDDY